jgi:hypothetical protein
MRLLPNLPASVSREVFATLCGSLPAPVIDTPETRAERDSTAIDAVAALHPADAFQAKLAADIVAAGAYAGDSFRLAGEHRNDVQITLRFRALANSFLRQRLALLRDYRRMQAEQAEALAENHPGAHAEPTPEPEPHIDADASATHTPVEQYAVRHPPDPEIVEGLVHGSSPVLLELDQVPPASPPHPVPLAAE